MTNPEPPQQRPKPVALGEAFWYWLKLGFISFGGPAGQIVLFAAYRIGTRALKNWLLWSLAALAFLAIFTLNAPFPLIVLIAAILGGIGGKLAPQRFAVGGSHGGAAKRSYGPAHIDDETPTPEHALFRWPRLIKVILAGFFLWGGIIGLLCARYGWDGALTQMAWFFTKAALLTFGGAYAVLPYVYQGAVEHYHWLIPQQMIDGLALGETTPGPLIMVVTFVGYVAGWAQELFGPESQFKAGVVAATVVTYFTFLPSFIFILAGGPLVESTHGNLKFTAPLTGITAAVVGVILNLALFFAYHVFWPQGFEGRFDSVSLLISLCALVALCHYKIGVIPVIAASGAAGFLFTFLQPWLAHKGILL